MTYRGSVPRRNVSTKPWLAIGRGAAPWDANYFLEQAERCFRLARSITDRETMGKLEAMGVEFMSRAVELDGNLAPVIVPAKVGARPA